MARHVVPARRGRRPGVGAAGAAAVCPRGARAECAAASGSRCAAAALSVLGGEVVCCCAPVYRRRKAERATAAYVAGRRARPTPVGRRCGARARGPRGIGCFEREARRVLAGRCLCARCLEVGRVRLLMYACLQAQGGGARDGDERRQVASPIGADELCVPVSLERGARGHRGPGARRRRAPKVGCWIGVGRPFTGAGRRSARRRRTSPGGEPG